MREDDPRLTLLFSTLSLGSPENAIGFVLWRLSHRFQRETDRLLAPLDLTHLQFTTLTMTAWLSRSAALVPQAEIARFCDMHPMQVSLMLKALETKGLVSREKSQRHARAKQVAVTRTGAAALERALPLVVELQRSLFGDEGLPGGPMLGALLALDARAATATVPSIGEDAHG